MTVFNHIGEQIEQGRAGLCFLDAPGGCGKTFLIETILASQRAQNKIAIATASSGLAATPVPGGRTVHRTFKVPLQKPSPYVVENFQNETQLWLSKRAILAPLNDTVKTLTAL